MPVCLCQLQGPRVHAEEEGVDGAHRVERVGEPPQQRPQPLLPGAGYRSPSAVWCGEWGTCCTQLRRVASTLVWLRACCRTLRVSKGWPSRMPQQPPTQPDTNSDMVTGHRSNNTGAGGGAVSPPASGDQWSSQFRSPAASRPEMTGNAEADKWSVGQLEAEHRISIIRRIILSIRCREIVVTLTDICPNTEMGGGQSLQRPGCKVHPF